LRPVDPEERPADDPPVDLPPSAELWSGGAFGRRAASAADRPSLNLSGMSLVRGCRARPGVVGRDGTAITDCADGVSAAA
jgi:hypothetical protein